MNIEVFSLCDAATNDHGKLSMLGAFDTIWATTMPSVYPQCSVAVRIRFAHDERGDHKFAINVIDLDGKHLIPTLNGAINISFPDEVKSGSVNIVLNLHHLQIPKFGEYSIDLAIDSRRFASLPLFVRERKQAPTAL